MDFYISYKDGKYDFDYSINNHAQFLVKQTGPGLNRYTIIPVKFNNHLPNGMLTKIYISSTESKKEYSGGSYYYTVTAYFKFGESEQEIQLPFCSKRPFCDRFTGTDSDMNTFIRFWKMIHFFKTFDDLKEVVCTENIFMYTTPEQLSQKINTLTEILKRYKDSIDKSLRDAVINWVRDALLRFGISSQKFTQADIKDFQEAINVLNGFGFQFFRN